MRYAISDIHGCLKTFRQLLEKIHFSSIDELYLLGDYIDRGPDSKGVIDYILELRKTHTVVTLRGNHEDIFLKTLNKEIPIQKWLEAGGNKTLASYAIKPYEYFYENPFPGIPQEHLIFFKETLFFYRLDGYWLVHAGLNFEHDDPFADLPSCLWKRSVEPDPAKLGKNIIVRGHTPQQIEKIRATIEKQDADIISIDAGCVYTSRPELGHLAAFNLDEKKIVSIANIDI